MKMKRLFLIGVVVLACQLFFAGIAGAATYKSSNDRTLNINVPLLSVPKLGTSKLTFGIQESLYTNVINPLGLSYEYSYIWISVNGEPILAVDPAKIGY